MQNYTQNNVNKERNYLDKVNRIIKKAFGITARGNLRYNFPQSGHDNPFRKIDKLECISKSPLLFLGLVERPIGRFESEDGSSLKVFPQWERSAERYADFYQAEFGKRPTIRLEKKITFYP